MLPRIASAQGRPVLQGRILDFAARQPVAGRGVNPVENLAAPAFDVAERHAVGRHFADFGRDGAGGHLRQHLPDDGEGLEDFLAAHDHAPLHVALGEDGHGELHLVVEVVREIAAQIVVEAGRAAGDADDAEVGAPLRA